MSNRTTLTVSEVRPYNGPRIQEEPCGGNGGLPHSFQEESPCPPEVLSGLRIARWLQEPLVRRHSKGFGMIELLNTIMIIAVVAAISLPMVTRAMRRAREAAAIAYLRGWPIAIELFQQDLNRYPVSLDELSQAGYLGLVESGRVQYTFTLAQKVAGGTAPSDRMLAEGDQRSWWTAIAQLVSVSSAWAAHKPDHGSGIPGMGMEDADSGHGNNPGGCDPDNPGQGGGGPCAGGAGGGGGGGGGNAGNAGGGWEGRANPVDGKGRHFYLDETGTIRFSIHTPASASSPSI